MLFADRHARGLSTALNDVEATIARWAAAEMAPWRDLGAFADIEQRLRATVAGYANMCLLRIENGVVTLDPAFAAERPRLADPTDLFGFRVASYLSLLNDAARAFDLSGDGLIALSLEDIFPNTIDVPVFGFQKKRGMRGLLLPDVDFMNWNFYADADDALIDRRTFDDKRDAAIFVGSTSGDLPLTATHVAHLRNARLRAAVRFRGSKRIRFDLPHIVQCDLPETEAMVRALDVGGQTWTWQEQLDFRYLLSMDGNGATCSRVAMALGSNSVLFKYNSPFLLYYFRGLEAWLHYVPIVEDGDVERLLDDSQRLAATFRRIVADSTSFARTYLTRSSVLRYSAELLSQYLQVYGQGAHPIRRTDPRLLLDLEAHCGGIGSRWARPGGWLAEDAASPPIEAFRLIGNGVLPANAISYSAFGDQGVESAPQTAGRLCGSHGQGRALHGVRIILHPELRHDVRLAYRARFADGQETRMVGSGKALRGGAPLTDLQVTLEPRRRWW